MEWDDAIGHEHVVSINEFPYDEIDAHLSPRRAATPTDDQWQARLTEIILLGVLAQRFNTRIEWDAKACRVTNHPELNAFIREPAREGWNCGEDL